jgi:hypothetical protein
VLIWLAPSAEIVAAILVQLALARFYQNVCQIIYKRDQPGRNFDVALLVQPLAQLREFIVDAQ